MAVVTAAIVPSDRRQYSFCSHFTLDGLGHVALCPGSHSNPQRQLSVLYFVDQQSSARKVECGIVERRGWLVNQCRGPAWDSWYRWERARPGTQQLNLWHCIAWGNSWTCFQSGCYIYKIVWFTLSRAVGTKLLTYSYHEYCITIKVNDTDLSASKGINQDA